MWKDSPCNLRFSQTVVFKYQKVRFRRSSYPRGGGISIYFVIDRKNSRTVAYTLLLLFAYDTSWLWSLSAVTFVTPSALIAVTLLGTAYLTIYYHHHMWYIIGLTIACMLFANLVGKVSEIFSTRIPCLSTENTKSALRSRTYSPLTLIVVGSLLLCENRHLMSVTCKRDPERTNQWLTRVKLTF